MASVFLANSVIWICRKFMNHNGRYCLILLSRVFELAHPINRVVVEVITARETTIDEPFKLTLIEGLDGWHRFLHSPLF